MEAKIISKEKRAFNNTLKSARLGVLESQYEVGLMYANGVGVVQSFEQALIWIRQAAERGFAPAQYLLATRYASGVAVEQDEHKAIVWYLKAAEQGHSKAFLKLGKLYAAPRLELSTACFVKAAELGLAEAQWAVGNAFATGQGADQDYQQAHYW